MVFTGKPSAGCENCRKAKKRCDRQAPSCSRCVRLGRTCGGYRDAFDLVFRDQSKSISLRLGGGQASSSSPAPSKSPTPDPETTAQSFFYDQFVSGGHMAFLEGLPSDDFLLKSITACGLAAMASRERSVPRTRELARGRYVDALTATNQALRDSQRVREDNTLIAVFLLAIFERVNWEPGNSMISIGSHVRGLSLVLQLRGRAQIRTKTGASLFRHFRHPVIVDSFISETEVPAYIVQWTRILEFDPVRTPSDQLVILSSRLASLRQAFRLNAMRDRDLLDAANTLEQDLLAWEERVMARGSSCAFQRIADQSSPHSWSGVRHVYSAPQACRYWNTWRTLRILLSRLQEAVWRRAWPVLSSPGVTVPGREYFQSTRNGFVADLCVALAYIFGNDSTADPPKGAVFSGLYMIDASSLAGTCVLENLVGISSSPEGSQIMFLGRPWHKNLQNQHSVQLAWLIERVGYIADKVGLGYANAVNRLLIGDCHVYYDIGRSMSRQVITPPTAGDALDLSEISYVEQEQQS